MTAGTAATPIVLSSGSIKGLLTARDTTIQNLRDSIGDFAGQLGQFTGSPWNEYKTQVDQAHRALPAKVPHTAFVSSDGLKDKGDKTHFDSDSYRELGQRYAEAYLKLAPR